MAFRQNLRLSLVGFPDADVRDIVELVQSVRMPQAPWLVNGDVPADAVLLARGIRPGDPEHPAVQRLNPWGARRRLRATRSGGSSC